MKKFLVVLFMLVSVFAGAQNVYVATPTSGVYGSNPDLGFGAATPVVVQASSTIVRNLCTYLPNDDVEYIAIQVTSGSAYLQGTLSTPSIGLYLSTSSPILVLPLPKTPKGLGTINVVASETATSERTNTLRIMGYRKGYY